MRAILVVARRPRRIAPLALVFAGGLFAACDAEDIAYDGGPGIVVSPAQARLPVGDTIRLRATSDGRPCDCRWDSPERTRVTVDATGLVRGLTPGSAPVIATYRPDPNVKVSALIEVVAP
jgi:hypothetical protein